LALTPSSGGSQQVESVPFTFGWQFTVTSTLNVTDLGYYDAGGDGLAFSHQVGIFNDSTQLELVSGTVDSGTTDPLIDGYRVIPVSYTLLPGTYDVLGFNPPQPRRTPSTPSPLLQRLLPV
jgi:hypothetical protein